MEFHEIPEFCEAPDEQNISTEIMGPGIKSVKFARDEKLKFVEKPIISEKHLFVE